MPFLHYSRALQSKGKGDSWTASLFQSVWLHFHEAMHKVTISIPNEQFWQSLTQISYCREKHSQSCHKFISPIQPHTKTSRAGSAGNRHELWLDSVVNRALSLASTEPRTLAEESWIYSCSLFGLSNNGEKKKDPCMRSNLHRMRFSSTACLPQTCNLVPSDIDTGRVVPRPELYLSLFFQGFCSLTEIRQPPCSQLEHSKQGFLNCLNCAVGGKIQELFYHFIPTYTLLLGRAQITALILPSGRIHTPS